MFEDTAYEELSDVSAPLVTVTVNVTGSSAPGPDSGKEHPVRRSAARHSGMRRVDEWCMADPFGAERVDAS